MDKEDIDNGPEMLATDVGCLRQEDKAKGGRRGRVDAKAPSPRLLKAGGLLALSVGFGNLSLVSLNFLKPIAFISTYTRL